MVNDLTLWPIIFFIAVTSSPPMLVGETSVVFSSFYSLPVTFFPVIFPTGYAPISLTTPESSTFGGDVLIVRIP